MRSQIFLTITLCLALLAVAGCNRGTPSKLPSLPNSNEVAGWTRSGEIRSFEAADFWKYIDGEAERYLKAGAQRVVTADYNFQNKIDATADVFTMNNAEGALKIFDSEPLAGAQQVVLGDGARLYSQSLVFRKGPYLVRIVAYRESAEASQALLELGRSIEQRLTA